MRVTISPFRNCLTAAALTLTTLAGTPVLAEEVYMIRGFADVFSAGMNQMTVRLKRKGIRVSAHSNGDWRSLTKNIISRNKQGRVSHPIIIVGHSLGGVEAPNFANALARGGVKVGLVIGLDPGFANPVPFGPGISQVINYRIPTGNFYRKGPKFRGSMSNIKITWVDHVGIDKDPRVQNKVIAKIIRKSR